MNLPRITSLRVKLILAAVVVQVLMLVALTTQNLNFVNAKLQERAQLRLDEEKRLLAAMLAEPMKRRDRAAIEAVLSRARSDDGVVYLVLLDKQGTAIARNGWDAGVALPPLGTHLHDDSGTLRGRFDTEVEIGEGGEALGNLRFGVSTAFLQSARSELIRDVMVTGGITLAVSTLLIALLSYWLTRNLRQLTSASERVAAGDFSVRLTVDSDDGIGRLTASFNVMAGAVRSRIEALAASEAKFHAIADYSYDVELWIGAEGRLIWINPRVHDMFGYTPEECLAMDNFPAALVDPSDVARTIRQIGQALHGSAGQDFEFRGRRKDGTLLYGAADWRSIYGGDQDYLGIRISIRDVGKRREAEQQLAATVVELRDAQAVQQEYLKRAQDEHARLSALLSAMEFGILFVNTDNRVVYANPAFNRLWQIPPPIQLMDVDPLQVLEKSASVLARPEEQMPYLFKLHGGGEAPGAYEIRMADGGLITQRCYPVNDTDGVLRVLAERIVRSIALIKFQFEGQSLRLTTSLGIAVFPDHARSAEELIAHADAAMYQAKDAGKNAWRTYRHDLDDSRAMVTRLSWNDRIAHALDNNLLRLHFQGIFDTADNSLAHYEVLVRMQDPDDPGLLLMPGQFIPYAEKSGKILAIDRWVIRTSIELLADADMPALAINISGRSFDEPTLPQYIADQLRRCAVAPRRLLVELTETSAVSDLHDARRFIEALRATGCRICLDDFGTGFSSFAYLKHLEADAVKIDGLFIRDLPNDFDYQLFVKAIVAVAHGMRKHTIAECVEDAQTLDMLRSFGVDAVQGFYLERPRPDSRPAGRASVAAVNGVVRHS